MRIHAKEWRHTEKHTTISGSYRDEPSRIPESDRAERLPIPHGTAGGDPSIDHDFNEEFVGRLVPPERLSVHRIPASAGLNHDIVCPDPEFATDAQVTEAYRQLSAALQIPLPDPLAVR